MIRLAALSVDLDPIRLYHRIFGLEPPDAALAARALDLALERFLDFAEREQVKLTLFVVAREAERPEFAELLRRAHAAGHELANHTLDHPYDLVRLGRARIEREVRGAAELLERVTGVRPRGFRAPGYVLSDELVEVVAASGHTYDSSVFPCPAYQAAKALARAALSLAGRQSEAILDHPAVLLAPRRPYRLGRPFTEVGTGIVELPIQVTRGPRLPYIGSALMLGGPRVARALTRMVVGEPLVNLELHALDLLTSDDGPTTLTAYQADLRISLEQKLHILARVVASLRGARYQFHRLEQVAEVVAGRAED